MPRLASLDVGSNTVRLLIAEPHPDLTIRALRRERIITRLGGDFSAARGLDKASMERTIEALRSFGEILWREKVEKVFAAGTGVLREARNGLAFLERVRERTGLCLRLLTGEEEALLMLRGVLSSLRDPDAPHLVTDVGGWSTEVLWVEKGEMIRTASLGLGAVALSEKFMDHDPPAISELEALDEYIRSPLRELRRRWEKEGGRVEDLDPRLVGTAGTATTLAAIDLTLSAYDPQKVNGHRISRPRLEEISRRLQSLPLDERRKIIGLEKGREDLIVAGSAILLNLLEIFERSALEVIDSGLLEGILLEGMDRMRNSECGMRNGE
jgi:exopolyphosphatase/guanosine-5'-triphosphate,3'-diphosphate pyrophosphatase